MNSDEPWLMQINADRIDEHVIDINEDSLIEHVNISEHRSAEHHRTQNDQW